MQLGDFTQEIGGVSIRNSRNAVVQKYQDLVLSAKEDEEDSIVLEKFQEALSILEGIVEGIPNHTDIPEIVDDMINLNFEIANLVSDLEKKINHYSKSSKYIGAALKLDPDNEDYIFLRRAADAEVVKLSEKVGGQSKIERAYQRLLKSSKYVVEKTKERFDEEKDERLGRRITSSAESMVYWHESYNAFDISRNGKSNFSISLLEAALCCTQISEMDNISSDLTYIALLLDDVERVTEYLEDTKVAAKQRRIILGLAGKALTLANQYELERDDVMDLYERLRDIDPKFTVQDLPESIL